MLHVDGSSNTFGARARLILIDPKSDVVGYALRFEFSTTNNEVKYYRTQGGERSGSPASEDLQRLPADGGTYKG